MLLRKILPLIFVLACLLPWSVAAKGEVSFSECEVDLWPEFDRPTMLVIYHMTLAPVVKLPAEVKLQIPLAAGIPNAVAAKQPDGQLVTIPYTQSEAGTWSELTFTATLPDLQIEYYDPNLIKEGSARRYEYTWPGSYAVSAFKVVVQEPVGASRMQIKPGMVNAKQGEDGLMYYTVDAGALAADQQVQINLAYQKDGDTLTVAQMQVDTNPVGVETMPGLNLASALPVILGLLGVLLIAGGGYWYWKSGRQDFQPARERRPRHKPAAAQASGNEADAEGYIYCHQCGKRATPGDRFCRACGTPLRLG
jgi:hypothetical protein